MFVFSFQKYIFFSLLQIKIFIFFHLEFFFKIKIFRKIIILILSYYLAQYNKKERISLGGLTKAMPLTIAVTFQRTSSALSIPIEKKKIQSIHPIYCHNPKADLWAVGLLCCFSVHIRYIHRHFFLI